jgi:hypothetical protein
MYVARLAWAHALCGPARCRRARPLCGPARCRRAHALAGPHASPDPRPAPLTGTHASRTTRPERTHGSHCHRAAEPIGSSGRRTRGVRRAEWTAVLIALERVTPSGPVTGSDHSRSQSSRKLVGMPSGCLGRRKLPPRESGPPGRLVSPGPAPPPAAAMVHPPSDPAAAFSCGSARQGWTVCGGPHEPGRRGSWMRDSLTTDLS